QCSGAGLAVGAGEDGAVRLRCAFQRLEGEVTGEGLWLTSTVDGAGADRFRVVADYVGRDGGAMVALPEHGVAGIERGLARFVRRGLVEEYSVSVDGVRQDFVVAEPPGGAGPLRVDLAVNGAKVEALACVLGNPNAGSRDPAYTEPVGRVPSRGVRLVLNNSWRKLAFSRLRVVDARGCELRARLEVVSNHRLAVVVEDAGAAYPVRIDPTFSDENWVSLGGLPGTDGDVCAAVVDASGNLYIGGKFTSVGRIIANNVAKWDGSAWSALGLGMNEIFYALAVSGNNLYAAGFFTYATNAGPTAVSANNIAKWDGSAWSALGSGMTNSFAGVGALAVSGTDLYAGGYFATAGGVSARFVARWDGSGWSAVGSGVDGPVSALAVSGGNLYAGGMFYGGIAKWNGSAWSALGSGLNNTVSALAVGASSPTPQTPALPPSMRSTLPNGTASPGRPWVPG
ncbi:MAG: hypothetical protein NT154_23245, partial [Verrucomicrobia bacterium]|nr:hypothetical protein [Verrucomicrobiota bacterium]